jgi:hypothetical protein
VPDFSAAYRSAFRRVDEDHIAVRIQAVFKRIWRNSASTRPPGLTIDRLAFEILYLTIFVLCHQRVLPLTWPDQPHRYPRHKLTALPLAIT